MEITIDPEFKGLLAAQTDEEAAQLRANIIAEGVRDALVVWPVDGGVTLIDGHNRLAIAKELGLPYETKELRLPDRKAAINWIIANQLGRRNLTHSQMSYLRGSRYEAEKLTREEAVKASNSGAAKKAARSATAARLGGEYGVHGRIIEKDAKFTRAVNAIAENLGEDVKRDLLTHKIKIPKSHVVEIADKAPEEQRQMLIDAPARKAQLREDRKIKERRAPGKKVPLAQVKEIWRKATTGEKRGIAHWVAKVAAEEGIA